MAEHRNLLLILVASIFVIQAGAHAESAREQMRVASSTSRNASFTAFLLRHGKACTVNESAFSTHLRTSHGDGDVWSVRCAEGATFAIFIGMDAQSTSWFMPCTSVERMSGLRCFAPPSQSIASK